MGKLLGVSQPEAACDNVSRTQKCLAVQHCNPSTSVGDLYNHYYSTTTYQLCRIEWIGCCYF
jgi:hypothetical protein